MNTTTSSLQRALDAAQGSPRARMGWHATLVLAGPWLFTGVALLTSLWTAQRAVADASLLAFTGLALQALTLSPVVGCPLSLVVMAVLTDAAPADRRRLAPGVLVQALCAAAAMLAVLGVVVFGLSHDVAMLDRLLGFGLLMASGALWIVMATLVSLGRPVAVLVVLGAGLAAGATLAYFTLLALQGSGLLLGLLAGTTLSVSVLTAHVLALACDARVGSDDCVHVGSDAHAGAAALRAAMRQHRHLALAGALYAVALAIDRWAMWVNPGALEVTLGVWAYPDYEVALALASLAAVPIMLMMLLDVEPTLGRLHRRVMQTVTGRGTLRALRRQHGALLRAALSHVRRLALLQFVLACVLIVASGAVITTVGGSAEMASVFRYGVLGTSFHALLVITLTGLFWLDRQRSMALVCALFAVSNLVLTALGSTWGDAWHGWGYAVAALLGLASGLHAVGHALVNLPYLTVTGRRTTRPERPAASLSEPPATRPPRPATQPG